MWNCQLYKKLQSPLGTIETSTQFTGVDPRIPFWCWCATKSISVGEMYWIDTGWRRTSFCLNPSSFVFVNYVAKFKLLWGKETWWLRAIHRWPKISFKGTGLKSRIITLCLNIHRRRCIIDRSHSVNKCDLLACTQWTLLRQEPVVTEADSMIRSHDRTQHSSFVASVWFVRRMGIVCSEEQVWEERRSVRKSVLCLRTSIIPLINMFCSSLKRLILGYAKPKYYYRCVVEPTLINNHWIELFLLLYCNRQLSISWLKYLM